MRHTAQCRLMAEQNQAHLRRREVQAVRIPHPRVMVQARRQVTRQAVVEAVAEAMRRAAAVVVRTTKTEDDSELG